ncbi:MAG: glycoside hydrolase family 88 protein [bacterium]|nr:glycoside hydrolase family 88 protein [Candidatus Kapabacteria bacterium]
MSTDWGQSLLAYGLLAAAECGNRDAHEYLRRWLTYHLGAGVHVTYFVGSWSIGLLYPDVIERFPEFAMPLRNVATAIDEHIRSKAIRNGRGVILHNVDLPHVYVDTVYYTAPVLAKLGRALGRDDWRDDAMSQLRAHMQILRDPSSGFSIHCEENLSGHRSSGAWARGNGWIAMTCGELLAELPHDSLERREIGAILIELATMLIPYQTDSGLWRTIINDPTSYEETSASAMFLFGLLRGRHHGVLPATFDEPIARCTEGLLRNIDDDGRFVGCSEGTWPGTIEYYKSLACGEWWWGTGALLLALRELIDTRQPSTA